MIEARPTASRAVRLLVGTHLLLAIEALLMLRSAFALGHPLRAVVALTLCLVPVSLVAVQRAGAIADYEVRP